jgi:multidrug efflux pump subunit AcrA (membrane-fusion protein)
MKQTLIVSFLLVLIAGCGEKPSKASETLQGKTQSLAVRTIKAEPRTFERRITVQGNLQSKYVANVAARIAGNLDAIFVDAGDPVEANKTDLFQIDPITLKNAVTASEQQLAVTKASLEVARATLGKSEAEAGKVEMDVGRYQRLYKDGRVTPNEFELRQVQYVQAKAGLAVSKAQASLSESQVEQAVATLEISRKNLKDSKSVAPISGFVTTSKY